jgi:hypothetical protein
MADPFSKLRRDYLRVPFDALRPAFEMGTLLVFKAHLPLGRCRVFEPNSGVYRVNCGFRVRAGPMPGLNFPSSPL